MLDRKGKGETHADSVLKWTVGIDIQEVIEVVFETENFDPELKDLIVKIIPTMFKNRVLKPDVDVKNICLFEGGCLKGMEISMEMGYGLVKLNIDI